MLNIDYSKYYWKNSLITLRHPQADDWREQIHSNFDSEARFPENEKRLPPL